MDNIVSWNIRGLNQPNKQVGMIGLLETKVKESNVSKVAGKTFLGWIWHHNFELNLRGHILIAWKPNTYNVQVIAKIKQLIHCHAVQLSIHRKFFITFVYGMNQEQQRMPLWIDLHALAQQIDEAWCILGDFNLVLYKEDRMGGNEIQEHEVYDFANLLDICELQEMMDRGLLLMDKQNCMKQN